MKKNFLTGLVLSVFALICALVLSSVNLLTKDKIKEMEEQNIKNAIESVYSSDIPYDIVLKEDAYPDDVTDGDSVTTYLVKKQGGDEILACIYEVTKKGFANNITMMISVNPNHEIIDYTVVSQNETKGDVSKHDFQMTGKSDLDSFDKLSGSTVSSKAVSKCFNTALYLSYIDMGGEK